MKKATMKKAIAGGVSFLLSAPVLAFAAYQEPTGTGLPGGTVADIINTSMQWLLAIIGVIAIIAFLIAGVLYLTSAGNDDMTKKAKSAMVAAITGVIVALIGLVVLRFVNSWLAGGGNTNF